MAKDRYAGLVEQPGGLVWHLYARGSRRLEPLQQGRVVLPDPDGQDGESVAEAVKTGCKGLAGHVTVGLPSSQLLLRVLRLPSGDEEELAGMVELQVDKLSPFPVDLMVISHEVLAHYDDHSLVLVAAVKEQVVNELGALLAPAGIYPDRVDASVLGWWQLLLMHEGAVPEEGRFLLVVADADCVEVILVQDRHPIVFRCVPRSQDMTETQLAEELCHEVSYTLMSLELEHGSGTLAGCAVWSVPGKGDELAQALHKDFACPVAVRTLTDLPELSEGLVGRTLARSGRRLDLTPASWRAAEHSHAFKRRLGLLAAGLGACWLLGVAVLYGMVAYEQWELGHLRDTKAGWETPALAVRSMRRRVHMIEAYVDRSGSALECLRELVLHQPQDVELTQFSYRKGELVRITGQARTVNQVYQFKNALDGSELFVESTLNGPRLERRRNLQIFDMDLRLAKGEVAE